MKNNNEMEKEGVGKRVLIFGHKCYRCNHAWRPYNLEEAPNLLIGIDRERRKRKTQKNEKTIILKKI